MFAPLCSERRRPSQAAGGATRVATDRRTGDRNAGRPCNGPLFSLEKEGDSDTGYSVNDSEDVMPSGMSQSPKNPVGKGEGHGLLCSNSSHFSGFFFFFLPKLGDSCRLSGSRFPHLKTKNGNLNSCFSLRFLGDGSFARMAATVARR